MLNEQIIQGCKDKQGSAQRQLYELVAGRMMGICLRYSKDDEEAKDLLQEGFIKVFQQIDAFRGEGSFEGWIKKIFINTALESIRKKKLLTQPLEDEEDASDNFLIQENKLEAKELLQMIRKLPDGYRVVFNLYAIEGYSHKEIGRMMNISEGTSKSNLSRARIILQKKVNLYTGIRKSAVNG